MFGNIIHIVLAPQVLKYFGLTILGFVHYRPFSEGLSQVKLFSKSNILNQ